MIIIVHIYLNIKDIITGATICVADVISLAVRPRDFLNSLSYTTHDFIEEVHIHVHDTSRQYIIQTLNPRLVILYALIFFCVIVSAAAQ